jgi:hypothetical protein
VKKIAAAAEGKNRRVLGDIGNLVTVRGIEGKQQPNRPVTRFLSLSFSNLFGVFCSQNWLILGSIIFLD